MQNCYCIHVGSQEFHKTKAGKVFLNHPLWLNDSGPPPSPPGPPHPPFQRDYVICMSTPCITNIENLFVLWRVRQDDMKYHLISVKSPQDDLEYHLIPNNKDISPGYLNPEKSSDACSIQSSILWELGLTNNYEDSRYLINFSMSANNICWYIMLYLFRIC